MIHEPIVPPDGCDWHQHSLFRPCPNGLSLAEYLALPKVEGAS